MAIKILILLFLFKNLDFLLYFFEKADLVVINSLIFFPTSPSNLFLIIFFANTLAIFFCYCEKTEKFFLKYL